MNHAIADFLAVIDFDEASPGYGQVINMVPLPAPGATFNEPHHMHLSVDGKILGCGGLLSVLSGQPGIFFFDMSDPRKPRFLFSTSDKFSSITDDFFPLPQGGFLITQMGSANGDAPGRVVEFDRQAPPGRLVAPVAPDRRVQPARHFRPARVEPDDDERLHPARLDPERRPGPSCPAQHDPGLGFQAAHDPENDPRHPKRWARWT